MKILKHKKHQEGVSLLEIMIALVVLSIGLIGMAALQLNSLQFVHSAHYRSMASAIALDFEERIWLKLADNSLSGCPGTGSGTGTAAADLISDWSRTSSGGTWDWSSEKMLKIPNLSITMGTPVTGTSVTMVPLTLSWGENRFSDVEGTTESYTYNVQILCRAVVT